MKNQFLTLTISAILGTLGVYGVGKLESFFYQTTNLEYADMVGDLADQAIPDLGFVILFFIVVYPYQFIVSKIQQELKVQGFTLIRTLLTILGISIFLYSIVFTFVFRSPYLGLLDTFQTFGIGTLIFGVYFLTNLSAYHFMSNIVSKKMDNE